MWTLYSSKTSPFGRKIAVGAGLCGVSDRIRTIVSIPRDPDDPIRSINPLGKLPTLVMDDGEALFDSPVILEWLDAQAGGGRIVPNGNRRFPALRLQAVGDGIMDASILQMSERRYHEGEAYSVAWADHQREKVIRGVVFLERNLQALSGEPHVGHIAAACALGYLDFRFDGFWRPGHPALEDWLEAFEAAVPSFRESAHSA
ncbi:glutathione S-transferase N-terminal domain-containing protein [Faunimonas sp. B44]|uniref:glutathione S-transferase N-terminal domain-containing protein n=1 Tax=Faunimonas sp. B44 TaxID=3461493 RepID=UPI004045147D